MFRLFRILVLALLTLATLSVLCPAAAQTTDGGTCQPLIAEVRASTETATFLGKNADQDEAGPLGKLDAASTKLIAGKPADALQALIQYQAKVDSLVAQGKLAATSADELINGDDDSAGVIEAIACVTSLIVAQTPMS